LEQNTTGINYRTRKRTNQEEVPKGGKKKYQKWGEEHLKVAEKRVALCGFPVFFRRE